MSKYIALLRGINVGGKNKIAMPQLKAVFEESGFTEVSTYINSGNIVFCSVQDDELYIREVCEAAILSKFNLQIPVTILSVKDLAEAMEHAPAWWGTDPASKHNAIFVIPPATSEDIMAQVGEAKPEYEQISSFGRVIFWSAPSKTFSRTRWSKIVGTAAYHSITIRNANTTKKLLQL
ncbi:MAG: DUF1697 domain-containing protein [Lachnospiraceae bacterium]